MTDFKVALAEFSARQAEREAKAQIELQHLKLAVILRWSRLLGQFGG